MYCMYVHRNFAYEKFGVVVVVVSSLTSGVPVSDPIMACSSRASPHRQAHVVLFFCQLSGPIPSWHPHLPLCGSSLLCQCHGLQDEACHSCRGGPSTGTDGGGGWVSHGGVEEGTYIGVLCVWGVKWSVHRVRTYVHRCAVCGGGGVECAPCTHICTYSTAYWFVCVGTGTCVHTACVNYYCTVMKNRHRDCRKYARTLKSSNKLSIIDHQLCIQLSNNGLLVPHLQPSRLYCCATFSCVLSACSPFTCSS